MLEMQIVESFVGERTGGGYICDLNVHRVITGRLYDPIRAMQGKFLLALKIIIFENMRLVFPLHLW
jgi:hypothetical protein